MNERGFTLIEVLVALALTALVATLAYGALSSVIVAGERTDAEAVRLQTLQRTFDLLQRDLAWVVRRPAADDRGAREPVFSGGQPGSPLLSLTRAGWPESGLRQRSELQRVHYRWHDQRLERVYWIHTDRGPEDAPVATVLLEDVQRLELRFLDDSLGTIARDGGHWRDSWLARDGIERLPAAVEIVLELEVWGEVRRLFVLPANG